MLRLTGLIAAGAVALISSAAMAQTNGWYLGAEGGWNQVPKQSASSSTAAIGSGKLTFKQGWGTDGTAGYGFGQFRVEGEVGYRDNGLKTATFAAGAGSGSGSVHQLDLMVNGLYDIPTGTAFTPFVGAGLGGIYLDAHHISAGGNAITNDNDWEPGYQGIAGVSYAVNQNLSLKLDYHYMATFNRASFSQTGAAPFGPGGTVKSDYSSNAVMLGFTYKFGQPAPAPMAAQQTTQTVQRPAPPPPPAPAPVAAPPPKNYLVFFDFNKSDVTPDAQKILQSASDNFRSNHGSVIHLTGHTDTVGTVEYNQALSVRRGNSVKAALVKMGIPENEITVVGKGKSDPLVPTADGVREPQNRRVEIVLE